MKQNPVNQSELALANTRSWIGVGLLLLSALGFTIAMLFANMAYKDGIDVHTTNAARYLATIVLLFLFQKIRGKKLGLPPRERYTSLALGISVFMMGIRITAPGALYKPCSRYFGFHDGAWVFRGHSIYSDQFGRFAFLHVSGFCCRDCQVY
jgi:hypothetical protein